MPCRDYYPEDLSRQQEKIDKLTRMLCHVLTAIEKGGMSVWSAEIVEWWREHKAQDARRVASEIENERRKVIRNVALSKLTAEERRALKV